MGPGGRVLHMILRYNGIELKSIQMKAYNSIAVFNGPDFLYTRHEIHIKAILNPSFTTKKGGGQYTSGFDINKNIRAKLLEPRGKLQITFYKNDALEEEVWLQTPLSKLTKDLKGGVSQPKLHIEAQDSNNGPIPLYCNITHVLGMNTLLIEYGIRTDINDLDPTGENAPAILSNRYDIAHEMDDQFFSKYEVTGRTIFNANVLTFKSRVPDQFRDKVIFPPPLGYRRTGVYVNQSQDGLSLEWGFTDAQDPLMSKNPKIAHIEVHQNLSHNQQRGTAHEILEIGLVLKEIIGEIWPWGSPWSSTTS